MGDFTGFLFNCVCIRPSVQAISCHYSSADCFYIDVKGTTQENIEKEVADIITRKYSDDISMNFQVGSLAGQKLKIPRSHRVKWVLVVAVVAVQSRFGSAAFISG